jgi:hypothetical protein
MDRLKELESENISLKFNQVQQQQKGNDQSSQNPP